MSHPSEAPPAPPPAPPPVYQTPDWETPTYHPKRRSILDRVLPSTSLGATKAEESGLATHPAPPPPPPAVGASSTSPTLRQRFDALLPPHRTYFGRLTRRALLLLLAALALACLVGLVVGLAVGLTRRGAGASSSRENLPLPSGTGGVHTGDLTYYDPGLGACGGVSGAGDLVVSVSHVVFDAAAGSGGNPNANPLCGRRIRIRRDLEGRGEQSVDVTVVDRCTGCAPTDLDTTLAVFERLARKDDGRVTASWAWLE